MEEITLTGGTLMASADSPANLSGGSGGGGGPKSRQGGAGGGTTPLGGGSSSSGGSGDHHHHSHHHEHGPGCNHAGPATIPKSPSELELTAPSPSLEELVHAPKEEILRALSTLFRFGRFEALQPLLEKLQEVQESVSAIFELLKELDDGGHSLLHWAAKRIDDIRFLQLVIDVIAVQFHDKEFLNIASTDNVGMRPLHWACTEGSIPHVALLLNHGADREAKDTSGCTPLLIAAQYGQVETVAYLLQKGANGLAVDTAWDTALHWAAYKGSIQVCGLLSFYQELDWMTVDAYGQTPLHLASLRGHTSVVRYILLHMKKYPKKARELLFLKDKNQRTPLDLAVHKNRPTVEIVLREAMAAEQDPRGYFFRKTLWTSLKNCTSMKQWKLWMGLTVGMDEVDEPMKGPYYFVYLTFFFHVSLLFGTICPIFNISSGILWDKTGWLFWNVICMLLCWYLFYKTVTTSPGYLDDSLKNIVTWRKLYEETLESYGAEDANIQKLANQTPLCHTCHVARPLRSKHCRITRKCVLVFDHYCPFVNNTIGLYNYKYFYLFLTFMSLALSSWAITLFMYLRRYTKAGHSMPWMTFFIGLEVALTGLPIFGMWLYHTQLTMVNLTTNEHLNVRKYKYLYKSHHGKKQYKNPWFKGWMGNVMDRFNPSERCYMIAKDQQALLPSQQQQQQNPGDSIV